MMASITLRILAAILAWSLGVMPVSAASGEPRDIVRAFNAAFQARDKDAVIATLAEGGAHFTLRSQHEDAPPDQLQSEISGYWTVIAPVLFASTSAYQRDIEILDARTDGDIATVWTSTRTRSIRLGATEPAYNSFTEVYLLIKTPDGWKIAALADNRQATKLGDN